MSQQNKIIIFKDGEASSSQRRGRWTEKRRLIALETTLHIRPFALRKKERKAAWDKVRDAINEVDQDEPFLQEKAVKKFVNESVKEAKKDLCKDSLETGTNDSEASLKNRALELCKLMEDPEIRKHELQPNCNRTMTEEECGSQTVLNETKRLNDQGAIKFEAAISECRDMFREELNKSNKKITSLFQMQQSLVQSFQQVIHQQQQTMHQQQMFFNHYGAAMNNLIIAVQNLQNSISSTTSPLPPHTSATTATKRKPSGTTTPPTNKKLKNKGKNN